MLRQLLITMSFTALLLTGCATTPMPLGVDSDSVDQEGKSLFLISATLENLHKPSFQPKALYLRVKQKNSEQILSFSVDEKAAIKQDSSEKGNRYLLRMDLKPGEYEIFQLTGSCFKFPFHAGFTAPLHFDMQVDKPGIFYLGHIKALIKERKNNEFRAGPVLPLIDQNVAGVATGTFDITISDQSNQDIPLFRETFPALKNVDIQPAILPSFDRDKAQRFWEGH